MSALRKFWAWLRADDLVDVNPVKTDLPEQTVVEPRPATKKASTKKPAAKKKAASRKKTPPKS